MTNTVFGDEGLKGLKRSSGRQRTNSFDLILFKVPEFWDEGLGFDYDKTYDLTTGNKTFDERPSNWYNRTTLDAWGSEGIYSDPEIITTIHFDDGNEDINVDITSYVNGVILDGNTDHGLGLAFASLYEDISVEIDQSVAFFTKYTQTFFEPFVETFFNDQIVDNRSNFIQDVNQNLYLYVTKGTNFYDLDNLPTADITNASGQIIPNLNDLEAIKIRKGVYKITFGLSGQLCDGKRFYYDKWKNLSIDGVSLNDITQKFVPKPHSSLYTIGENQTELQRYAIQFFGIKQSEKIKRGDLRKVVVTFRSIDVPKTILFDEVYYRIYIKEGHTNVNVYDWTKLDITNENSFFFDTSFMIPREYTLEIKAKTHTEEIFYKEGIKFEIVSEK